jgi:hypothetical protein
VHENYETVVERKIFPRRDKIFRMNALLYLEEVMFAQEMFIKSKDEIVQEKLDSLLRQVLYDEAQTEIDPTAINFSSNA